MAYVCPYNYFILNINLFSSWASKPTQRRKKFQTYPWDVDRLQEGYPFFVKRQPTLKAVNGCVVVVVVGGGGGGGGYFDWKMG